MEGQDVEFVVPTFLHHVIFEYFLNVGKLSLVLEQEQNMLIGFVYDFDESVGTRSTKIYLCWMSIPISLLVL